MKTSIALIAWFVFIPVCVFLAAYFFINGQMADIFRLGSDEGNFDGRIVNLGSWLQTVISLLTLIITSFAITQVLLVRRQLSNDEIRKQQEAYRRLIDPQIISIKRYLRSEKVKTTQDELDAYLSSNNVSVDEAKTKLDELRHIMKVKVKSKEYPLFTGTVITLDHVELLLNEYNSLSKMVNERQLSTGFSTELGLKNFTNIYEITSPIIKLRQIINSSYAKEFAIFCDAQRKTPVLQQAFVNFLRLSCRTLKTIFRRAQKLWHRLLNMIFKS